MSKVHELNLFFFIIHFIQTRHYHYEYKLTKVLWKIDMKDILFIHTDFEYGLQNIRNTINVCKYEKKIEFI